jgi:hypothetical protein
VIGNHLAWRVGNGEQARIGVDSALGCGETIRYVKQISGKRGGRIFA